MKVAETSELVDESERLDWCRRQLVGAAQLLALSPEQQAAALPSFVHVPDELRLVYGDAFVLAAQVWEAGLISDEAYEQAVSLDTALRSIPSEPHYEAAVTAVATSPAWEGVRAAAGVLVLALGARVEPPDLDGQYVQ